jgi:hypothetical protein
MRGLKLVFTFSAVAVAMLVATAGPIYLLRVGMGADVHFLGSALVRDEFRANLRTGFLVKTEKVLKAG